MKKYIEALNEQLDEIQARYHQSNMAEFDQYTAIMLAMIPIFKQAEIFDFLLKEEDISTYKDLAKVKKLFPRTLFPSRQELAEDELLVVNLIRRVVTFAHQLENASLQHKETPNSSLVPLFEMSIAKANLAKRHQKAALTDVVETKSLHLTPANPK